VKGGEVVYLPVCYGGDFGPDLEFVACHNGLSPDCVLRWVSCGRVGVD